MNIDDSIQAIVDAVLGVDLTTNSNIKENSTIMDTTTNTAIPTDLLDRLEQQLALSTATIDRLTNQVTSLRNAQKKAFSLMHDLISEFADDDDGILDDERVKELIILGMDGFEEEHTMVVRIDVTVTVKARRGVDLDDVENEIVDRLQSAVDDVSVDHDDASEIEFDCNVDVREGLS